MARTKRRCFLFPAAAGCCVVAAKKFPGAPLSCLIFDSHRLSFMIRLIVELLQLRKYNSAGFIGRISTRTQRQHCAKGFLMSSTPLARVVQRHSS